MTAQRFRVTVTAEDLNGCPDDRAGEFLSCALHATCVDLVGDVDVDSLTLTYQGTASTVAGHAALRALAAIAVGDYPAAVAAFDELEAFERAGVLRVLPRTMAEFFAQMAEREGER